jgi:hypothetical protein
MTENSEFRSDAATVTVARPLLRRTAVAWRPVWLVAGVVAVVHLAVAARYGWHHDEFYYVMCGRHPAFGYVDQPPLTPLLAALAATLPGGVLPLRVLAVAAQVGCVVLTGVLAAEFGGQRRAQVLASAAVATSLVFVGGSMLFGTTVTDQLAWAATFVLTARALRTATVRAWLLVGVVAGVGLENKDTIAVLLLGIAIGLWAFRRDVLRTPGPWLAGGLAVLIAAPNVVWDATHGWPNLAMAHVLSAREGGPLGSLAQLPVLAILLAGPLLVGLWVLGVRRLAGAREHRWALVVAVVAVVVFTAAGGKEYYAAPVLVALFAAGAVRVETVRAQAVGRWWPAAIAVSAVISLLLGLPVLPPAAATALRPVNPELMQTYGWPEFVDQVARAATTVPPGTPIFTSDYGEAGSLAILDPGLGHPVYSSHNNYALWGPPAGTPDTVLCVGRFTATQLHRFWSQVTEIAPITFPDGLRNDEVAQHAEIYLCTRPHGSWAQLWPSLRHYS